MKVMELKDKCVCETRTIVTFYQSCVLNSKDFRWSSLLMFADEQMINMFLTHILYNTSLLKHDKTCILTILSHKETF